MPGQNITEITISAEFNNRPDVLCVSSLTAGNEIDTQILSAVNNPVKRTPILCNTGCIKGNITRQLSVADGAACATTFKIDSIFEPYSQALWILFFILLCE